jgi:hypothetical protein
MPPGHLSGITPGSPPVFRGKGGFPGRLAYPAGLLLDPFYSDAIYSTGYPVAAQPPVIVVQPQPAAEPLRERSFESSQPLMIELHGDHYVRVSGEEISGVEAIDQYSNQSGRQQKKDHRSSRLSRSQPQASESATRDLPAIDLIFRDGHREQVSQYTIAVGVLYTNADYYNGGSWNRKIEISSLDVAQTITLNRSRGVNFQLPKSPNEVIVGP